MGLAAGAGVDLVHVRERDLGGAALAALVARLVRRANGSPTRIVVNDRLDVALAAGASGVHLRGDSVATDRARGASPGGFVIGRSVRTAAEAARESRAGADYLVLGTVFPTPSKPGDPTLVGPEGLRAAAAIARVPVLGIGGISEARVAEIAATGAAGIAAIRLFWGAGRDAAAFRGAVARWRRQFDLNRPNT
ncbi:MAG: thiamine phosphate synthase [Acidobacteria bacterium]|nr:MAG: thiamine phosphate synthase [Acidobacteriota bacterium]